MQIRFSATATVTNASIVIGCFEDNILAEDAKKLDAKLGGLLTRAMTNSKFKGSRNQSMGILCPSGIDNPLIVIIGLGKADELNEAALTAIGGNIYTTLASKAQTHAEIHMAHLRMANLSPAEIVAHISMGTRLRAWKCNDFKTQIKPEDKPAIEELIFIIQDQSVQQRFETLDKIVDGVNLTKELVTYPPNIIYPESMAERLKDELKPLGVKVDILDLKDIKKLGMGSLLGVAQGSAQEPRVVVMQWQGADSEQKPLAFIGKGVTFDSGGISLKPSNGMADMKYDMAGAGVVSGLIKALAGRKAKVNAIGVVGLVENMPSGTAQRPSDIVKSMSGQTIEVLDTDAEGRLVLADVLWYTQDKYKPQFMINLATLTGAIVVALGDQYAGLFSNNEQLAERLTACGERIEEKLWRLPMGKGYDKDIDSDIADVKNIGGGRKGGSITAAQFLQRFVNKTPWAHLDIAGTTWAEKNLPHCEKGATAFGVRLLNDLIKQYYER